MTEALPDITAETDYPRDCTKERPWDRKAPGPVRHHGARRVGDQEDSRMTCDFCGHEWIADSLNLEKRFEAHRGIALCEKIDFLENGRVYVTFSPEDKSIHLDGIFTIPQLEEILAFLRAHPPTTPLESAGVKPVYEAGSEVKLDDNA